MNTSSAASLHEQPFQVVADAIADAVVLTDDAFGIISWNSAAEKMFGYPAQAVLGSDISHIIPSELHAREHGGRAAFLEGKPSSILHTCIVSTGLRSDGSRFPTEVSSFMWRDGERTFYGAIIRDISERAALEKKTKEARDFLETLFATSPDGILVTDADGCIMQANQAFLDMLGYTRSEIIGRHSETFYAKIYDPEVIPPHIEQVFRDGSISNYETKRRRKDGTIIDVELSISLLSDSAGKFKGMVSCMRNITERKLMEHKREQLIGELQEAMAKVKTLSGLLPICASCKRIRDDRGYWNQIESFLHAHSGAQFSHGLCPDCMRKLYPELTGGGS